MKILRFQASNFMRLSAVEIEPDSDGLVILSGRNGQGKSSVLNAIWAALGGKEAAPADPIHSGAEEASISLDLGDMTVLRKFKRDAAGEVVTSLVVRRADGSHITKTPQAVLNALWDRLAIDPLVFAKSKPAEQFETLKRFVDGFDFDKNAAERKTLFEERTDANRDAKRLRAQIAGIVLPSKKPVVEDVTELLEEQKAAIRHNEDIAERGRNRTQAVQTIADLDKEISDLEDKLEAMQARRASLQKRLGEAPPLPVPIPLEPITARLAAIQETSAVAAKFAEHARLAKAAELAEDRAALLTKGIEACDEAKAEAIAKSKLPVKGLDLIDGAVTLNGHPFDQASTAEQLRASIAIAGAMAPALRVLRVAEGSMLDQAGMQLVEQYARANDLQIWMEVVSDSGDVGFVIENGELAQ